MTELDTQSNLTEVEFYLDPSMHIPIAVFPKVLYNKRLYGDKVLLLYAHYGQHSGCNLDYLKECKKCTDVNQYADLVEELTLIGYNLKILNGSKK